MSTILTIYSNHAFKRFLLPGISDADYSILLAESLFHTPGDIELKLEITDNQWFFVHSDDYELEYLYSMEDCYAEPLRGDAEFQKNEIKLLKDGFHVISIIIREADNVFSIYEQFDVISLVKPLSIGRSEQNDIVYDYCNRHLVSTQHAIIYKKDFQCYFQDNDSANGSFINNRRVEGSVPLSFGDCIDIFGLRLVFLGGQIAINTTECDVHIKEQSIKKIIVDEPHLDRTNISSLTKVFHRAPRRISKIETTSIKIDDPPSPKEEIQKQGFFAAVGSALSMALPMLLGCFFMIYASSISGFNRGIFMYVGLVTAVTSAVIGTVRSVSGMRRARREYEEYERLRNEKYGAYLQEQENVIREKYEKNTYALRDRYLSANECCDFDEKQPMLWSRNVNQQDFLSHRLGIGNLPFQIEIEIPNKKFSMTDNNLLAIPENIRQSYSELKEVPVCIDLLKEKLIGVVGGRRMTGGVQVLYDLLIQIAANNSYTDVKIALIYDEMQTGYEKNWSFVKWLPHVWNETKTFRYISSSKEEASNVFYELNKIIRQRIDESGSYGFSKGEKIPHPYYVIFVIAPEFLEGELISQYILNPDPLYGMTTVYLTERYEQLPNQCEFIIENSESYSGMYRLSEDYDLRSTIQYDQISAESAQLFASRIASIELQEIETGGDIPESISFLEMYGVRRISDLDVLNRWKKNRTYETMKALVGQKAGGVPCYLDIHEKYHGPHGLVAGTTGSGKSETLQTYILSLAVNYSPDDVAFFIIDYKGGGMANLFNELPHMIGQISNLSGNQINRALVSIQSEKDRREALFADYGVKDIRDYTKLYKNHEASVPLPHLIIVIDEFAEMKKEEPEFIQEIVSVSRVGRSLGIHLIMATQKPAGSVSDDIWANSRFKLCLRVQSKQDSMDMLHKADAAYLTQSGRCYLQVGNDELYELFQSGYSGAVYFDDEEDAGTDIAKMLNVDGIPAIEGNHARLNRQKKKRLQWINTIISDIQSVCGNDREIILKAGREEEELIATKVFHRLAERGEDYPESENNKENLITLIEQIGENGFDSERILEAEEHFTNAKKKLPQQPERTQLEVLVAYLKSIARENHYDHDFSLFLPLLPERISLRELPEATLPWNGNSVFNGAVWPEHGGKWSIETGIGLYDDPENQRQDVMTVNFAKTGDLIVFGAPSTGKTTLLQTMIYGMIYRYSPAEISIYIMEYSAHRFSVFEKAPHVGGIIRDSDDNERVDKLFTMFSRLLEHRKRILGEIGFDQYVEVNGAGSVPAVFLVIDGFSGLVNRVGDRYHAFLGQLTKEGLSYGIFLVVSAAGSGSSEIPNSLSQNFKTAICLELNNTYDYGTYLRTSHLRLQPESGVKGRGIAQVGERVLEFQTALPVKAENDLTAGKLIESEVVKMNEAWTGYRAANIPEIPENSTWRTFSERRDVKEMIGSRDLLPIGYDAKYAEAYGLDLSSFYVFIISGSKKKGKTNALKLMMESAAEKKEELVVVDFNHQFGSIAKEIPVKLIRSVQEWAAYLVTLLKEVVAERNALKGDLLDNGAEETEIYEAMQKFQKIFIFIDDLPNFVEAIQRAKGEDIPANLMPNMEMIIDRGALHNIYWITTVDRENMGSAASSNLFKMFVRDKKGLHLGGAVHSTASSGMSFENHDRRTLDKVRPAGWAMLPIANNTEVLDVVLPLVKNEVRGSHK